MTIPATIGLYAKVSTKSKKKHGKKFSRTTGPGRTLSQDEVSEHVASRYRSGHDAKNLSRGVVEDSNDQAKYLKELNARPALVLNADYQVRSIQIKKSRSALENACNATLSLFKILF